jgi:restriction system protein
MPVPDFQSILLPFLRTLEDGAERSIREMGDLLAANFSLTESELQELLPSGQAKLFSNRVAWAKTHLKNAGLVDNPTRGRVRISELGRSVLEQSPPSIDMKFLRQYESYQRFTGQIRETTDDETPDTGNLVADIDERTPLELFESSYAKLRAALAEDLLSKLIECSPQFFKRIVVKLLHAMGYGGQFGEGKVTNYSHDGGIDGVISEDKLGLDRPLVKYYHIETALNPRWDLANCCFITPS